LLVSRFFVLVSKLSEMISQVLILELLMPHRLRMTADEKPKARQ